MCLLWAESIKVFMVEVEEYAGYGVALCLDGVSWLLLQIICAWFWPPGPHDKYITL